MSIYAVMNEKSPERLLEILSAEGLLNQEQIQLINTHLRLIWGEKVVSIRNSFNSEVAHMTARLFRIKVFGLILFGG